MKLSTVIPCYNEEKNIPLILKQFQNSIEEDPSIEVILVNNGSTDHSQMILDHEIPKYPFAKSVLVPVNQGYGYGILQGLKAASGDYLSWTHADLQTDPKDVIKAFKLILQSPNPIQTFVKGRRKNRPLFDTFFTIGMSVFETLYLQQNLWDINAQPNLFHRSFFETWQDAPYDFGLDLYAFAKAKQDNLHIIRFDVLFSKRIHGISSWNTSFKAKLRFIKRTLAFSRGIRKNLAKI